MSALEDLIIPGTAVTTGDKGNTAYGEELAAAKDSQDQGIAHKKGFY